MSDLNKYKTLVENAISSKNTLCEGSGGQGEPFFVLMDKDKKEVAGVFDSEATATKAAQEYDIKNYEIERKITNESQINEQIQKILNVRNDVQKALFQTELAGQISDGYWENASPKDHWKFLSGLQVNINPSKLGKNFDNGKNYPFHSSRLLDIVGQRMLAVAKFVKKYGFNDKELTRKISSLYDRHLGSGGNFEVPDTSREYYKNIADFVVNKTGVNSLKELTEILNNVSYSINDLKKDLKDLSQIFKNTTFTETLDPFQKQLLKDLDDEDRKILQKGFDIVEQAVKQGIRYFDELDNRLPQIILDDPMFHSEVREYFVRLWDDKMINDKEEVREDEQTPQEYIHRFLQTKITSSMPNRPPVSVPEKTVMYVDRNPQGEWEGHDNQLALFMDGKWHFFDIKKT